MKVFIVRPEDGLFLKADGTWSEVREEAKEFPDALSAREFSESLGVPHTEIYYDAGLRACGVRRRPPSIRCVPRGIRRARRVLRARLVVDEHEQSAAVICLCSMPVLGQILKGADGRSFQVTSIVAMGDGKSEVTLYVHSLGQQPPPFLDARPGNVLHFPPQ